MRDSLREKIVQERKNLVKSEKTEKELIGKGGFLSPDAFILKDAITSLSAGKHVLLKGPTGSGKTKLAESISSFFSQPMHMINCSVDLDAESLLGYKTLKEKNGVSVIDFIEGPVITAMKKGHLLYIDEINMAKPETLPILNGVLDYRQSITNPFTGEVVKAHSAFSVIAAINEGYIGTVSLNEALKNRFIVIDVPYLKEKELKELLVLNSAQKEEKVLEAFIKLSSDLIFQAQNGQISEDAASIRALLDAADLSVYMDPLRAVKRAIADKLEEEREKAAVMNIAESLF